MIEVVKNTNRGGEIDISAYSVEKTKIIRDFHTSLPDYNVTPLVELKNFKNTRSIFIKDESKRFGLKAFKGLGGVWAIYTVLSRVLGLNNPSIQDILAYKAKLADITFITTTDGNHGKGIAWAAQIFGCKSLVFMPKGTVDARKKAIEEFGAKVTITDMNYDDCVKFSADLAARNGFYLVQDTSWAGYEEIPAQIMLGYSTLAYEALNQMNFASPTHIFLQAGVGSMAGAVAAVFASNFKPCPRITIVEPAEVACFYETMRVSDGKIHSATGSLQTIMAGLNCATPCELAWKILRRFATDSATISDKVAENAMRTLAKYKIIAGESGCAGFALANAILDDKKLRQALEINSDSIIFVINTEGDTDPINYKRITQ